MPAMVKEVTTNSDERRRRLRHRHAVLGDKAAATEALPSAVGLPDGLLLSEAQRERAEGALIHPALDELETRFGWQGASTRLGEPSSAASPWGSFLAPQTLGGEHALDALRPRDARVAQLKRRSGARGMDLRPEEIALRLGGGEPLPAALRMRLEPALGLELGGIRLHRGEEAARLTEEVGALAFASGSDVVLGAGAPDLGSKEGIFLLTHELAHVAQQARGQARSPEAGGGILDDAGLEQDADRIAAQVAAGPATDVTSAPLQSAQMAPHSADPSWVRPPTAGQAVQMFWGDIADAAGDLWDSATEVVGDVTGQLWDMVASLGKHIPGYELITLAIGYDPLAGKAVPRNATNVVQGLLSLVPGGVGLFNHLKESGALGKAFEWFKGELTKLNITTEGLKGLVTRAVDSLGMGDILDPEGAIAKLSAIFANPWARLKTFTANVGNKVMEFVMEGVLAKAGPKGQQILGVLRRAGNFVTAILKDPVPFLNNLVTAVRGGLDGFTANAPAHVEKGLIGWLTGAAKGGGLRLPGAWDIPGILGFTGDVLGLTWDFFRPRVVRLIGEQRTSQLEQTYDYVKRIVSEGISAVADIIAEAVGDLRELVFGTIKEWSITKIIKAGVLKLASMFNPAGALIQSIMGIYNTICFFIERMDQIKDFAVSVIDSVENVAAGKVAAAAGFIEQSLARGIPVLMGFLSRFAGLGNITKELKNILAKVRAPIERGIDKACDWIAAKAGPVLDKLNADKAPEPAMAGGPARAGGETEGGGVEAQGGGEKAAPAKVIEKAFSMKGESHKIIMTLGPAGMVEMASKRDRLSVKIGRAVGSIVQRAKDAKSPADAAQLEAQKQALIAIGGLAKKADLEAKKDTPDPAVAQELASEISAYAMRFNETDIDELVTLYGAGGASGELGQLKAQAAEANGQFQRSTSSLAKLQGAVEALKPPLDGGRTGASSTRQKAVDCIVNTQKAIGRAQAYFQRTQQMEDLKANIFDRLPRLLGGIPQAFQTHATRAVKDGDLDRGVDIHNVLKSVCFATGVLEPETDVDEDALHNITGGVFKVFDGIQLFKKLQADLHQLWVRAYGGEKEAFTAWAEQSEATRRVAIVPTSIPLGFESDFVPFRGKTIADVMTGKVFGFLGAGHDSAQISSFAQAIDDLALEPGYYPSGVMAMVELPAAAAYEVMTRLKGSGSTARLGRPSLFYQMVFPDNNYIVEDRASGWTAGADGTKDAAKSKRELVATGIPEADFMGGGVRFLS